MQERDTSTLTRPWNRRPGETNKAFRAFGHYLESGAERSVDRTREKLGYKPSSVRRLRRWAADHDWAMRAQAYDDEQLVGRMERREREREQLRQRLFDAGLDALNALLGMETGEMPLGSTTPILDKHQQKIGERPLVPASVRQRAIEHHLGLLGLVTPKRVELSGRDGDAIRLQAAAALDSLPLDKLEALAAAFGVLGDDGEGGGDGDEGACTPAGGRLARPGGR